MSIIIFILIPIIYTTLKFIINFFFYKFSNISYRGFNAFGFKYDEKKETFNSTINSWQRNFGYTRLYDVFSPILNIIIDTLPIVFNYDNKNWLITFWKGQYGMTTGGEVGIYYTDCKYIDKNTFFFPIKNKDMLDIELCLYKKNKYITQIKDKHWWLATFKLGMFSNPKDLSLTVKITFKNKEMLHCFLKSFKKYHYSKKLYYTKDNVFYFNFKKSHAKKVWTRFFLTDMIIQNYNKKRVKFYNEFIKDNVNNENGIPINDYIPDIFKNDIGYNLLINKRYYHEQA